MCTVNGSFGMTFFDFRMYGCILGEIIRVGLFMFVVYIGNVITAKTITFTGNSYPLMNFQCVSLTWVRMNNVREITHWRNNNQ